MMMSCVIHTAKPEVSYKFTPIDLTSVDDISNGGEQSIVIIRNDIL